MVLGAPAFCAASGGFDLRMRRGIHHDAKFEWHPGRNLYRDGNCNFGKHEPDPEINAHCELEKIKTELACGRGLVAVHARFSLCRVAADLRGWHVRSGIDLAIQYREAAKLPSVLRE